jgi:ABC-type branched-subunit amino acid transport system ATPase component
MILAISDQALVLDRGQVVLQESAARLLDRPDLLGDLLGVKR